MILTGKTQVEKADAMEEIMRSKKPVKLIDKDYGLDIDGIINYIYVGPDGYEYDFEVIEDHKTGHQKGDRIAFWLGGLDEAHLL